VSLCLVAWALALHELSLGPVERALAADELSLCPIA